MLIISADLLIDPLFFLRLGNVVLQQAHSYIVLLGPQLSEVSVSQAHEIGSLAVPNALFAADVDIEGNVADCLGIERNVYYGASFLFFSLLGDPETIVC